MKGLMKMFSDNSAMLKEWENDRIAKNVYVGGMQIENCSVEGN